MSRRGHCRGNPLRVPVLSIGKIRHIFLAILIGFILASCQKPTPPLIVLTGQLPITVVKTITAGKPVTITVGPAGVSNGIPVTLIAVGSYGPRIYQSSFHNKTASFVLSGNETQQSGIVSLTAVAGQARGMAQLLIQPTAPVEPLTPLVGARAIIADAAHWSMTVLVPFDAFGNPVMEGTRVEVLVLHPGNRLEKQFLIVHNLLAWTRVFSGTKAGRSLVVARIGLVHGFESTLLEVAGWPVPFGLSADPQPLPADGRLITTLRTDLIHDKFGNVIPDGTELTFIVNAPDGSFSYIPAHTIDGVAEVPFQAPQQAGDYRVQATILGVVSKKLVVRFTAGPAIGTFPITTQKDMTNHNTIVQAGPLLGSLGQYIPDGTPVRFIITNISGQTQELDGVSDAGYAHVALYSAQFPNGTYRVQVIAGSGRATRNITLK